MSSKWLKVQALELERFGCGPHLDPGHAILDEFFNLCELLFNDL